MNSHTPLDPIHVFAIVVLIGTNCFTIHSYFWSSDNEAYAPRHHQSHGLPDPLHLPSDLPFSPPGVLSSSSTQPAGLNLQPRATVDILLTSFSALHTRLRCALTFAPTSPSCHPQLSDTNSPPLSLSHSNPLLLSNFSQHTLHRGHGLQGLVIVSVHRLDLSVFVVISLSPLMLHHRLAASYCEWEPHVLDHHYGNSDRSHPFRRHVIPGRMKVEYPGEAHRQLYEVAMLYCRLNKGTAADRGGRLFVVVEGERVAVHGEEGGTRGTVFDPSSPPPSFPFYLSYCSAALFGRANPQRVLEWLLLHQRGHRVAHFHLYDAGAVDEDMLSALQPWREHLEVTDVRETVKYQSWAAGQVIAINDCAYRSRLTSRWVLFIDLDEYIFVRQRPPPTPAPSSMTTSPATSLAALLKQNEEYAWVSFGSIFFFTKMCSHSFNLTDAEPPRWQVERMIFRQAGIHCVNPGRHESRFFCLGFDGHRKYVADPRKVMMFGIHAISRVWSTGTRPGPWQHQQQQQQQQQQLAGAGKGEGEGRNLDARDVHLNHYRGLNSAHLHSCRQFIQDTDWTPNSWARDFSLSHWAAALRWAMIRERNGTVDYVRAQAL